ncbi:hypothetical protein CALVIDRAFT_599700 [Calocera viscosa TUFC12733]|uniref:Uncharacterized protein n=1 Tax=Calocera viscosa (strain TUFC12733) TaxID=1330018 RepID=A0A167KGG4_CALVF|nr:hypothetical protein CALVIDRAFT_602923 [Calocera viscosa TUFC12733]KZO94626.1 hypothetical protein CALVIDRAFT_599700 [Calocera viscosa TUFC12733]
MAASVLDGLLGLLTSIYHAILSIFEAAFALLQSLIKAPFELIAAAWHALTGTVGGAVGLVTGNLIVFLIVGAGVAYLVMNRTRAPGSKAKIT